MSGLRGLNADPRKPDRNVQNGWSRYVQTEAIPGFRSARTPSRVSLRTNLDASRSADSYRLRKGSLTSDLIVVHLHTGAQRGRHCIFSAAILPSRARAQRIEAALLQDLRTVVRSESACRLHVLARARIQTGGRKVSKSSAIRCALRPSRTPACFFLCAGEECNR